MTKALSIAELAAMAAEQEDQTVVSTTTFDNDPPAEGITIGRFIEYIELGKQKQPDYNGKKKPDADSVRLTFELLHPKKNIHEYEVEGEARVRADRVSIRISKKMSDKAKFKKLFSAMTYGRDSIKHMAQMLGEAFIIHIYHNVVTAEGKTKTYVNLDKDGAYGIRGAFQIDALTEERTDVPVQEAISPLRLFLFNNPTKETWDSLFIDGTREVKTDGGAIEHVSKNWLQELIMSATNYTGSALQALLGGVDDLPTDEADIATQEAEAHVSDNGEGDPPASQTATKTKATVAKPAEKPSAVKAAKAADKPKAPANDALAALGLV